MRLADGSTLHLDSASAMNVDLRGRTRQLHLVQGQVYLEVMLDGRAMEVQVDDARIQVFGTRLQIARYSDHDELLVLSGKAAVLQGGDQRMVSAGERVTFMAATSTRWRRSTAKPPMPGAVAVCRSAKGPGRGAGTPGGLSGQRVWLLDEEAGHRRVSGDFDLDHPAEPGAACRDQHLRLYNVLGQGLIVR
jgi:ferric-dicitrate binding protein FerR (iron transport regulator)